MTFLIDECLHPSLVGVAEERDHQAHYLVYLGMQGWKDPDVLKTGCRAGLHAGDQQCRRLSSFVCGPGSSRRANHHCSECDTKAATGTFGAVLDHLDKRALVNTVVEVGFEDDRVAIIEYDLPDEQ